MRGKALGAWGAITGVAVAAGPLIGGAIVEGLVWQWVFWLNVPVGILIAVLTTRKVREGRRVFAHVDLVCLALATFGVFGIAQALIRGNETGWVSASILGGLIGGWLFGALGIFPGAGIVGSIIVSFVGAVILVALTRMLRRA